LPDPLGTRKGLCPHEACNMLPLPKTVALIVVLTAVTSLLGCSTILKNIARTASGVRLTELCAEDVYKSKADQALRDCNKALAINPKYGPAYFYRALAYQLKGNIAQEELDLDRAIEHFPSFAEPYAERCTLEMTGNVVEQLAARNDCDKAVGLSPRDSYVIRKRFQLRMHVADYEGALADARTILSLQPGSAFGMIDMCAVYIMMRRVSDARLSCHQAETADSDREYGYRVAAVLEAQMSDWASARADADRGVALSPNNAWSYNQRCWVLISMNDLEGAKRDCAKALALSNNEPEIRDTRAGILMLLRNYNGVIADESAMATHWPRSPYGFGGRCAAELKMNQPQKALRDCERALALDPNGGDWYVLRGNVYQAQGKTGQARADYEHAFSIDPTSIEALREQAKLELRAGNVHLASTLAATYVAKNEYDPLGHEVYGTALAALGKRSEAIKQFGAALSGYRRRGDNVGINEVQVAMAPLNRSSQQ